MVTGSVSRKNLRYSPRTLRPLSLSCHRHWAFSLNSRPAVNSRRVMRLGGLRREKGVSFLTLFK